MATSHSDLNSIAAVPATPDSQHASDGGSARWPDYARMAIVAAAILVSRLHLVPAVAGFDPIGMAGALIGGYPIVREAIHDALARRMTMELSMTIALVAALAIREVFTADVIILFVLFAELVEEMTMHRGQRAVHELIGGLPETAELLSAKGVVEVVEVSHLKGGDVVLVRPGMRVPVDGKVIEGNSFVDQSAITGELEAVEVARGSHIFAGSVNRSGAVQIRAECLGSQTVYGRMLEALKRAEESRAPVQKLADQLAGYLVYFALACALATLIATHNARSTISVIIVAGACGIAAGTPLAILGGLGRAARIGAIVKGGFYLEKLGVVDTVVFDKTGTLTAGNAEVADIDPVPGVPPTELLRIAASAELYSEHPLARAILRKTTGMEVHPPAEFAYHAGRGVTCLVDGRFTVVGSRAFLLEMGVPFDHPSPSVAGALACRGGTERKAAGFDLRRGCGAQWSRSGDLAAACPRTPSGSDDRRLRHDGSMLWRGRFTSTRFTRIFCRIVSSIVFRRCGRKDISWRWSATGSTTRRRWRSRTYRLRWARRPISRRNSRESC